jgi:hypothetical protein
MKATIDIPEDLYRQVKAKSALEGRAVREVAIDLFRHWVEGAEAQAATRGRAGALKEGACPPWFGFLRKYAANAGGRHDMESVRESIARGRSRKVSA